MKRDFTVDGFDDPYDNLACRLEEMGALADLLSLGAAGADLDPRTVGTTAIMLQELIRAAEEDARALNAGVKSQGAGNGAQAQA